MDREATNDKPTRVDIDAIDTDMNARAGVAELIPWLRDTEAECCHVGGLPPYVIRIACSPQADSWLLSLWRTQTLVPLIPRLQWVRPRCRCCGRLPVAP